MKSHFYHIYTKPDAPHTQAELIAVRQGFQLFALVFGGFWLLYHRAWFWGVFYVLLLAIISLLPTVNESLTYHALSLRVAVLAWLGFEAASLRGAALIERGYHLADITVSPDALMAEAKFFEKKS